MLRSIILGSLLACISTLSAQVNFEHDLLELEKLRFATKNDSLQSEISYRKVQLYLANQQVHSGVFEEVKRVEYRKLPDSLKTNFLWNAALISYLSNEQYRSTFYLDRYGNLSRDSSVSYFLMQTLVHRLDTAALQHNLGQLQRLDSAFTTLTCFEDFQQFERKNPKAYKIASGIVPGLGSMMNGYWLKGTSSLLFSAGMLAASYAMFYNSLYVSAITWGVAIWGKFYGGNLRLTEQLFEKRELQQKTKLAGDCELVLTTLLQKYPLQFK